MFWTGKERRGAVWQVWPVVDGFGGARYGRRGSERSGLAGTSKAGGARLFLVWKGLARTGAVWQAWLVADWIGREWRGKAGKAWKGEDW